MDIIQLLPILAACTSTAAVLFSAFQILEKYKSEKKQVRKLNTELIKHLTEIERLRVMEIRNNLVHGENVDNAELENIRKVLVDIMQELHDDEMQHINLALNQNSDAGKIRYTDKILTMPELTLKQGNTIESSS
ncbi:TPA: hypothetical protein ACSP1Y_004509 [Aeromonas hydrophila]|uniref:hypothetical protein n=1 Tax=Aeromonas hydrophila TaxID=644 RepID=UPI0022AF9CA3|nr:hypothetical protein [Aeromonas hydrophila]MCZ4333355.1 hypothetical protein [Aeromonas hydrophila]